MKEVTLTELRKNIFRLVDEALVTGEPILVKRKGRSVKLVPETVAARRGKLAPDDEEGWAKFWVEPPPPGWETCDLSLESLNGARNWDGEPELDR